MTPTKLLIGQILVVFAIVIAGVWAATQWAAAMLAYQPELGLPWFRLGAVPVYHPWALFGWWYHYDAYAPIVFDKAGMLAGASGFVGCAAAIFGSLWRARQSSNVTTYGSARWASPREIERAGLHRNAGVMLGTLAGRYLRHDGPEHIMAFAPTRSGKGVGLVVPTLLSWTGSTVVHDIKGENWTLTAGWRARFSHCLLFNPTDAASAHYNPLLEVRRGIDEVRDVQNIADILVDPEGALERRNHWEKTSHSLLVGAILHILYAEKEKTLARVATFLSDPQRSFVATLRRMMTTNHLGDDKNPRVHPVVASAARELLNKSENERSGVLSTAMSFLGLYRDPTVAEVTSRCDWRIADLIEAERPLSLYLVIPPSDISRTKPLIRLVLNQIGRRLTERLDQPGTSTRRHQLLMMLDEFPALGRLDFFETSLAFMAGYGIRALGLGADSGETLAFQPLRRIDDASERSWAGEWIAALLAHEKVLVTPEVKDAVWSALGSLASAPPEERTLTGLAMLLQSNALRTALTAYTLDGPYGRLLDAAEQHLALADLQCFETESLMGQAGVVAPVLTYLFHRLEERFDGRQTLLVLDEAWIFLDHPLFAARIREWLKTLRKKNVAVLFATQSLADIADSSIAPAIIESCPQRILLPNDRAIEPQSRAAYERFGLNERQIELVSRATPKRHYYLQSARGNRLFELGLGPIALALCGASEPATQARIDALLAEHGPEDFAVRFLERAGLDWAAGLLADFPVPQAKE